MFSQPLEALVSVSRENPMGCHCQTRAGLQICPPRHHCAGQRLQTPLFTCSCVRGRPEQGLEREKRLGQQHLFPLATAGPSRSNSFYTSQNQAHWAPWRYPHQCPLLRSLLGLWGTLLRTETSRPAEQYPLRPTGLSCQLRDPRTGSAVPPSQGTEFQLHGKLTGACKLQCFPLFL